MAKLTQTRGLLSFSRPVLRNAAMVTGTITALMAADVAMWRARLHQYGPEKLRLPGNAASHSWLT
jgi:hypothetical protein